MKFPRTRMTTLGALMPKLTHSARAKRGFHEERLLLEWPRIVGEELTRHCVPQKVAHDRHQQHAARLHLLCEPAWAIEIQYMEPMILEKIAVFFGYKAIEKLVIHQGPLPEKPTTRKPKILPDQPLEARTAALLDQVQDPEMKAALSRLAQAIHTQEGT